MVQKNAYNSTTRQDRKKQPLGGCRKMKVLYRKKYINEKYCANFAEKAKIATGIFCESC